MADKYFVHLHSIYVKTCPRLFVVCVYVNKSVTFNTLNIIYYWKILLFLFRFSPSLPLSPSLSLFLSFSPFP